METNPSYQRDISPELIFEGDLTTFQHPLEGIVTKFFADRLPARDGIDVTILAGLLGTCSRPDRGVAAYRTVAADVLSVMTEKGVLVRHGDSTAPRVEDGGYWWTLKGPAEVTTEDLAKEKSDHMARISFWHFPDRKCSVCGFTEKHVGAALGVCLKNNESLMVCRDCVEFLRRAAHCWKPIPGGDWLPIETYFDGKVSHKFVGLCGPDFMCVGLWDSDSSHDWIDGFGEPCAPTHWIPLPSHPLEEFRANHQAAKVATEPVVAGFEMVRIINCADIRYSVMKGRVQVGVAVMNNEGIFTFVIEPSCRDEFLANLVDRYAVVAPS